MTINSHICFNEIEFFAKGLFVPKSGIGSFSVDLCLYINDENQDMSRPRSRRRGRQN